MKTGYGNAVAALLVASGWVAAQAPLPISYTDTKTTTPAATAPAVSGAAGSVQPASHQPQEEIIRTPPTPNANGTVAATAPAGPEPATHILPYGGYIDPARHYTVWGNADFIMWRINNG